MKGPVSAPRIELLGLEKVYAARGARPLAAVRGVSLSIGAGEFVSVEGPSGCGKTTLLNLVGLLDTPTQGSVRWDGSDTRAWNEARRARHRLTGVGFIFQRFYLLPTLTARENVELPLRAMGVAAGERKRRAANLLERVSLAPRADAFPHQLSGGEEQRVAIARALANGPGLLLADEPTGELDSANAQGVLELLVDAQRSTGATVVIVTHNPAVAVRARRHLEMADGRIVRDSRDE